MTEHNEKNDRVAANNWFSKTDALKELDELKFAAAAIANTCGSKGSYEREMAENALRGIRWRIDYLHDSLRRLLGGS